MSIRFSGESLVFGDFSVPGRDRMDNLLKVHSYARKMLANPPYTIARTRVCPPYEGVNLSLAGREV